MWRRDIWWWGPSWIGGGGCERRDNVPSVAVSGAGQGRGRGRGRGGPGWGRDRVLAELFFRIVSLRRAFVSCVADSYLHPRGRCVAHDHTVYALRKLHRHAMTCFRAGSWGYQQSQQSLLRRGTADSGQSCFGIPSQLAKSISPTHATVEVTSPTIVVFPRLLTY